MFSLNNINIIRHIGVDANHSVMVKARSTLHRLGKLFFFKFDFFYSYISFIGGAIGIPSWGKFLLAILNVYDWEGVNLFQNCDISYFNIFIFYV